MHIKGGQVMEHMPGRFLQKGQNQATLVMAGPPRRVGNTYHFHENSQTISQSGRRRDLDLTAMRKAMLKKIYGYFRRQPKFLIWKHRVPSIVLKIEQRLFVDASTKEEYMDQNTLDHRLHVIIKSGRSKHVRLGHNYSILGAKNVIFPSSPIGATPQALGLPGCLGQQQPSNMFLRFSGNNMLSSTRLNATSGQCIGGLNNGMSYNISQLMDIGMGSGINQWPPSFGSLTGALDVMPNFMENETALVDGPATTSEEYLNSSIYDNDLSNSTPFQCNESVQISSTAGIQHHNEVFQLQIPRDHQLSELQYQETKNVIIEDYSSSFYMEPQTSLPCTSDQWEQMWHPDLWITQSSRSIPSGSQTDAVVKQGQCFPPMEQEVHGSEQDPVPHLRKATHQKITQQDEARQPQSHLNGPICGFEGNMSSTEKIKGVSLTEMFTSEQVKEYIQNLRQCVGQSKLEAKNIQAMVESASKNSCQLCGVEKHFLEPPPIYCSLSNDRIKRNGIFYTVDNGEKQHYFCNKCYSNHSKGFIVEGVAIPKTILKKQRNTVEIEEAWVQCDKCEAWQHQICALFNPRRNGGGQAEYTCPFCYIQEIESGERKPLPETAFHGAKDLPRTSLSDHIEQRLFRNLEQERQQRAKLLGKKFDEVQGAEGLVVRVVSSIDKKLEVKPRFLDICKKDDYPSEFPYRSQVIMLFQKIEGVDVCLFSMHVQEFGFECPFPNKWHVYLSYLDSVKYFRPEIKAVTGEALRTFVYHEILIGYLDYCKRQGFVSCHIWASPPLKGDDYILNCHPETQKLPKSDRLRDWYRSMLQKALKENIVVERTDLYDRFFVAVDECKAKASVTRLPYFDGDYLPDVIEDSINLLQQEEDERKAQKRGRKTISRRAMRAAGYASLSGDTSKDILLMQRLGETIYPAKEEFIIAKLQYSCSHCWQFIVEGKRWICSQCRNFQLCQMCHDVEQRLHESEKHPIKNKEKHSIHLVEENGIRSDNKGKEETIGCCISQTRDTFLNFCRVNHLQYDTLRRAKHSSMMLLYHLHNPDEPFS